MRKIYLPATLFKNLILLFTFLLFAFWANAGTITSIATGGSWTNNATWVGGVQPVAGDNVIINGPVTIANGNTLSCFDLQINDGKLLTLGNKNFTVNGTVTIQGNGNIVLNGAFVYGTTKILIYTGTTSKTVGGEWPSANGPNQVFINNSVGVTSTAIRTITNLTIGNTTANSIFNDGGFQLTATGTFTLTSGTFNIGINGAGGGTNYPNFGINNIAAGTTVNYNSDQPQTIKGVNYANLSNSGNGSRTFANSPTIGISGTFTPGTGTYIVGTSTVSFNGTIAQTIPSFNPSLSFYNLIINNAAGISSIASNVTVTNSLALTSGVVTTGANKIIIPSGGAVTRTNGWINGNLQQYIPSGASSTFFVGSATVYRSALVNFSAGSTAGSLTVVQLGGFHPQIATSGLDNTTPKAITPYWNLTASGGLAGTYDATFNFVSGDVPGGASTNNFIIRRYNSSWATTIPGIKTTSSTQATGLTGFGDFCIGEIFGATAVSTQPNNAAACLGNNASFTSASASTPTPTVQWQRSTDGTTWVNIISTTDGGKYTNFTTNTLNITAPDITMTTYQYRSVYTNINGTATSNIVLLTVTKLPTITLLDYATSPFANITATPQTVTLTGTNAYTGGTFTSDVNLSINATSGDIIPNTSTLGNHTVTYTIPAAGGCGLVSATTVINITTAPTANIVYPANSYCISDNSTYAATLTGTGNYNNGGAGFYSVSPNNTGLLVDASTGAITPNGIAGTYTITYHIPATTSPTFPASTSDKEIVITPIPTATITYPAGPFCTSDQTVKTVTLSGGTGAFSNGVFSASPAGLVLDATTGDFTPNGSTGNTTYTVTYTIPASGGCAAVPVTATPFNIVAVATASISYNGGKPYCQAITTPQAVTLVGASGGSFSSLPVGLTINAAGAITPSTSIAGDYDVTYTIPASGPCGVVQITTTVTISETPTGNISYPLQPYCTSDPAKAVSFIIPTGPYAGGIFSSTPGGLAIDASTGAITPASSTPNSYTVNYNTPNGCPVIFSTPVEVDGSPTATISYVGTPFCITDGSSKAVTLGGTGTFTGGNYSSTLGLSIDAVNGDITPSTSTAGTYIVTYTIIPASPNCAAITTTTSVTITPAVGVPTAVTISNGSEPSCQLTNATTTTTYASTATNSTSFNWSVSNAAAGSISSAGVMTWANGFSGTVDIQVTANGCNGLSAQVIRTVTVTPSVTTPVFSLGATSARCQGAGTITYDAAATNTTGITYSLDPSSLAGGNAIVSTTGDVTFAADWSGTSIITASAAGCNGPLTATHTVTITPTVGTPVFSLGATSTRCQGAGPVTYTATATNNTGIAYSLDPTSLGAGNTIVPGTGVVTYTAGWSGTSVITASATGCNGPVTATHTVTVIPTVTIAAFSPATSTRCQGAGTVTTTTTATNSTGITYSLDAASITGGNTIVAATGAVTYAATWSGTTTITASAAGCNGPATTTLVVTVNATAVGGTVTPTLKTECYNLNNATITLGANTGTVIRWEQSIDFGTTWTTALVTNSTTYTYTNLTQTTYFRAVVQSGVCVTTANSAIAQVIVNPAFVATIAPSPATVCVGLPLTLTASGYTSSGLVIDGGTFVANQPPGWTGNINVSASNNSANGDMDWGLTNQNTKVYNGQPYGSPTWPYFIVGGLTATNQSTTHEAILTTPVFSLVGMSTAGLAFNEGYHFSAGTYANIEISTDASHLIWTPIRPTLTGPQSPYNTSTLGPTTFIDLNAYLGRSNLQIRFFYHGTTGSVWALDNVVVTNSAGNPTGIGALNPLAYSWSPSTDLNVTNTQSVILTATTTGVKTYTVTTTAGTCTPTTTNVTVTVNPTPSITAMTSAVCSATAFSVTPVNGTNGTVPAGTTYSWGLPVVTGGITGGATGTGASSITGTLTNPTNTAQTATYTATPLSGTCTGATFTVTVTVNPKSSITPITAATCSGTAFTVTPVNGTNGIVPTGTTYSWSAPSVTGLMTGGVSGTNVLNINGTLINPTNTVQAATYTVTPTSGTCSGSPFTVTVTVNPTPSITAMTAAICSGGTFSVTPANGTNGLVPPGTTYSWSTPSVTSGITGGASGSGAASIGGTLSNSTTVGTATYTVTPTSGTCPGTAFTVTVTVNPVTVGGTLPSVSICTSGSGTLTLTGNVGNVVQWESSPNGSAPWTVIANTTTSQTYTVTAATIFYRALVQSGTCTSVYSNIATVGLHNVWTGVTSTDWNTPSNWSDGLLPSNSCPDVIITKVANKPVLSSGIATINNLVINSGASLTVTGIGVTLQIAGTITNSGGTFNVTNGSLDFNGTVPQTIAGNLFSGNTLKNLTVSNTSLAVSGGGGLLNITGDLAFGNVSGATLTTNNNIVLVSTDTSTARVADITNGGARSGNSFNGQVTVQRYFPALRAWRLITSPLSNTGNIFNSWQNGGLPATIAPGNGTYVTGTVVGTGGTGNGLDNGPFLNPSLKTGSNLTDVNNTITTMLSNSTGNADNIGYLMFVRGDRNPINTVVPNTNTTTLSSKGKLQTGTQTFQAIGTLGAFTLIGNPYASPVDLNKVTLNNLAKRFYVWDPKLNLVGGYILLDDYYNTGTFNITPPSPDGKANQFIQSSEAFFVQTSSDAPASIIFNEDDKSSSNNLSMFRPMNPGQMQSFRTNLYLLNDDGSTHLADGNLAEFDDSYNPGVDLQDALKFYNVNETIGLLSGSTLLGVNRRPPLANSDTLFYKFIKNRQRKYQFEFIAAQLERDNLAGFVEDKFLNKLSPLNMNNTTKLNFEVTADAAAAAADRFRVVFKPSVVYTKVAATVLNSDIGVEWSVANEFDIKSYDVERSTDGTNFTKLGAVVSSGNSTNMVTYSWLDVSPALGYYYYRVRSISNSNVVGHSNVVKVKINKSTPAIYVFPNPVTQNEIHLQMNSMPQGVYNVRLINNLGQVILANRISHASGTSTETMRPDTRLLSGIYQLQVTAPDKKITMVKVIVD